MPRTASPSLRSRTVPTKATTAPTPGSAARSAATSAPRSKSASRTLTGPFIGCPPALPAAASAAGHRREERDLGVAGDDRVLARQALVERTADRTAAGQRLGMRRAARDQPVAKRRERGAGVDLDRLRRAEAFAQRGKVAHIHLHSTVHAESGRKRTASPRRMLCPGGLSTRPSAHTSEVSTAELWLPKRSSPPASLTRTRRNSRRRSGFGQSKSARIGRAC